MFLKVLKDILYPSNTRICLFKTRQLCASLKIRFSSKLKQSFGGFVTLGTPLGAPSLIQAGLEHLQEGEQDKLCWFYLLQKKVILLKQNKHLDRA